VGERAEEARLEHLEFAGASFSRMHIHNTI
jgi:hypothetical protein